MFLKLRHHHPIYFKNIFIVRDKNPLFVSGYSLFIQSPPPISYQHNLLLQVSHSGYLIEIKSSNKEVSHSSVLWLLSIELNVCDIYSCYRMYQLSTSFLG